MGTGRMIMKTLPALWRDSTGEKLEVVSVSSDSPKQRRTTPVERLPLKKEQQVVAEMIFATLEALRGEKGRSMSAESRNERILSLEDASLDILDACLSSAALMKIKVAVEKVTFDLS